MNKLLTPLAMAALLAATSAQATVIRLDGPEKDLQEIVNSLATDGSSSVDVVNDQYALDQSWQINSVFTPSGRIVMELAGFAGQNLLGLYDIYNPNNRVQLFAGADGAGARTLFDIGADGRVYRDDEDTGHIFTSNLFGFYLETPVGRWYSQSGLNTDSADHLVAYQGEGDVINTSYGPRTWSSETFLLGWEDLAASGWDQDYNDFVLLVSGVKGASVPEPATMGLLGLGLAGIGVFGRRRRRT